MKALANVNTWQPSQDHKWLKLLNALGKYCRIQKQKKQRRKSASAINGCYLAISSSNAQELAACVSAVSMNTHSTVVTTLKFEESITLGPLAEDEMWTWQFHH